MIKNILCLLVLLVFTSGCKEKEVQKIKPKDIPDNAVILDVRTLEEHKEISLEQAHYFVPLDELKPLDFLERNKITNDDIYLLCRGGGRALKAAKMFQNEDYDNVIVIEGGIMNAKDFLETK